MVDSVYDCPIETVEGMIEIVYAGPGWMEEGKRTHISMILQVVDSLDDTRIGDKTQFVKLWLGKLPSEDPESVDETGKTKSQRFFHRTIRRIGGTLPNDEWCVTGFQEDRKGDGPFVTWCKSFQGNLPFHGKIRFKEENGYESNVIDRADPIGSDVHRQFLKKKEAKGNAPSSTPF